MTRANRARIRLRASQLLLAADQRVNKARALLQGARLRGHTLLARRLAEDLEFAEQSFAQASARYDALISQADLQERL